MTICALELEDLLQLMATDIDNDAQFIRVDKFYNPHERLYADSHPRTKALYLGPIPADEPE